MTVTAPASFSKIRAELGVPPGTALSMNDAACRQLAGKPSGTISLSDFVGKSSVTAVIGASYRTTFIRNDGYGDFYEDEAFCTVSVPGGTITSATWTIISGSVTYTSPSGFNRTYRGYEYRGYRGEATSLGIRVRCVVVSNLGTFTVEKDV